MTETIITLNVIGMNCMGCVKSITNAVKALTGVIEVNTDLAQKTVTVTYNPDSVKAEEITEAIANEGFKIKM